MPRPNFPLLRGEFQRRARERWAALRVTFSPRDNPFLGRSLRGEGRGAIFWRATLLLSFVMAFVAFVMSEGSALTEDEHADWLAWAWAHATLWLGLIVSVLRAQELLRSELLAGRIETLAGLPHAARERANLLCAPPFCAGILPTLLGLPAFAWLFARGEFGFWDALGWILLGLFLLVRIPAWRPQSWNAQLARAGAAANEAGWKPPSLSKTDGRWTWPILIVALAVFVASPTLWPGILSGHLSRWPAELQSAWSSSFWFPFRFVAIWMTTPHPFFALSLPPFVLLAPLWWANLSRGRLERAANLAFDRRFWTREHQNRWLRAQFIFKFLFAVFLLGFALPIAFGDDLLAPILAGTIASGANVAAWGLICLSVGALAATSVWRGQMRTAAQKALPDQKSQEIRIVRAVGAGIRASARLFLGAFVFWIVTCLLCAQWPFSREALQLAPPFFAVMAIWCGAQGAFGLLQLPPAHDRNNTSAFLYVVLLTLWLYAAPLLFLLLWARHWWPAWLPTEWWPLFSPWTLWLALHEPNSLFALPFWTAIGIHGALALLFLWRATRIHALDWRRALNYRPPRRRSRAATAPQTLGGIPLAPQTKNDATAPTGRATPASVKRTPLRKPRREQKFLLQWLERFENPLLVLETRRAMGQSDWKSEWLAATLAMGAICLVLLGLSAASQLRGIRSELEWIVVIGSVLVFPFISLLFASKIIGCYDRDRQDRALETLFLTPLLERAIAWAKLGPPLVQGVPLLLAFWPTTLPAFALAAHRSEPMLAVLWLIFPFALVAFTARNTALWHLVSLKARRAGEAGQWGTLLCIPIFGAELIGILVTLEKGLASFCGGLAILTLWWTIQSALLFWWSVVALRKLRGKLG